MTIEPRDDAAAQATLDASRQRVEERLGALRQALDDVAGGRLGRLGRQPWTLPLVALGVGFSLAQLLRRRARRY